MVAVPCDPKLEAARGALEIVKSLAPSTLGVGTGSTVARFIEILASGRVRVDRVVASSIASSIELSSRGVPVHSPISVDKIDVYVDGADEVAPDGSLLKGRGGAMLGEKVLAASSRVNVFIVDESKLVDVLGSRRPVPVEVVPYSLTLVLSRIRSRWPSAAPRPGGGKDGPAVSDWGGVIVDVPVGPMRDPAGVDSWLRSIPGVVVTGIFVGLTDYVVVGKRECGWEVLRFARTV